MKKNIALVLTGGGARGAYQAGVIAAAYDLLEREGIEAPFNIFTGTSTGSVNAVIIANEIAKNNNPSHELKNIWTNLTSEKVYNTGPLALSLNGIKWIQTLMFGGFGKPTTKMLSLLDTAPLRSFIDEKINFELINKLPSRQNFRALAVSAVNYSNGTSLTSYIGTKDCKDWDRNKREGRRSKLTTSHIMASSAIPLVFPPILNEGHYFGDGGLRDYTPLSPAIKLGAEKLFVIGVRKRPDKTDEASKFPTPARILSMILNGILLDAVDLDYERLTRINETLKALKSDEHTELRSIDIFMLTPSVMLSDIAEEEFSALEKTIQILIKGLGSIKDSADIISYILFDKKFTSKLFELGKKDFLSQKDKFLAFIKE